MTSRISHTTLDCRDGYAQSLFWAGVLGFAEDPEDPNGPEDEENMIWSSDGATCLLFITVADTAKVAKNRWHLDLRPTDDSREAEVERVVALGASVLGDRVRPDGTGWIVLADPEGNEFCVLTGQPQLDALQDAAD